MSSMLAPGVRETTTTTGTGTLTLSAVTGSVAFSEAFADNARVCYAIKNGNNWEWGIGTVGAAKTLARTIPVVTYVGGVYDDTAPSAISLVGTSEVFCSSANNLWMIGPAAIATHTVLGIGAGSASTTGNYDTAVGYQAQNSLTTGGGNTAVGGHSQLSLTTGSNDTAVGYGSQRYLTTGNYDTAVGHSSQYSLTTGNYDTAVGYQAQYSLTTGNYNTVIGQAAQYSLTTGSSNTAVGQGAQYSLTTGAWNTAVGRHSQLSLTTGSGNVTIGGYSAAGAYAPVYDVTTENNIISLGSTAATAAYVNVAWTVVSDERDKTAVETLPHGLDVISRLRPVMYERRTARGECGDGTVRYGFIAQEVLDIIGAEPVVNQADPDRLGLHSDYITALLVRAVQQLLHRVNELEEQLDG